MPQNYTPEFKKIVSIRTCNMACVPQFDTMHPSMSLGANFNDRNFNKKNKSTERNPVDSE